MRRKSPGGSRIVYRWSYAVASVAHPILDVEELVAPFDNERGFLLIVLRAGVPANHTIADEE